MIGRHLEEGDVWWQLSEEGGVSPGNSGTKGRAAREDEGREEGERGHFVHHLFPCICPFLTEPSCNGVKQV